VTLERNISRSQEIFLLSFVKNAESAKTCISATGSYINPIIDLQSPNPAFHRENQSCVEETQTKPARTKFLKSHERGIIVKENPEHYVNPLDRGLFN
jgi:hypothetical protein